MDNPQAMNKTPHDLIMKLKDPDEIFDLVCVANYSCGNFNQQIPVDESRKAFKRIKKLLIERIKNLEAKFSPKCDHVAENLISRICKIITTEKTLSGSTPSAEVKLETIGDMIIRHRDEFHSQPSTCQHEFKQLETPYQGKCRVKCEKCGYEETMRLKA